MLRTRLYLGLLPLLLILVGTGAYAIRVGRELAGSLSRDLVNNYRAIAALQQMRESATQMGGAVQDAQRGDPLAARRAFEEPRAAFLRALMEQAHSSSGSPRATLVVSLDRAFQDFLARSATVLRAGGAGSRSDQQGDATALFRVLDAIETLTRRDAAADRKSVV